MRRHIFYLILILFLSSCKESSEEEAVVQKFPVVIRLEHVISSLPELKSVSTLSSSDSLLNKFGVVYYLIFDATGKYMHQKKQLKGDESFGQIKDELKAGQYTVVLLSSTGEMTVGSVFTTLTSAKVKGKQDSGDIYYKKLSINVTEQGFTQSVLLDRIIGCVQIRIKDRIADNVSKIELQTEDETPMFNLGTDVVDINTKEKRSISVAVDATNRGSLTLGLLVLNDQFPLTATVNLFDASNKSIKTTKIPGIVNVRGQRYSVEGSLSDFMSAGFTIGYNDIWTSDSIFVNF